MSHLFNISVEILESFQSQSMNADRWGPALTFFSLSHSPLIPISFLVPFSPYFCFVCEILHILFIMKVVEQVFSSSFSSASVFEASPANDSKDFGRNREKQKNDNKGESRPFPDLRQTQLLNIP